MNKGGAKGVQMGIGEQTNLTTSDGVNMFALNDFNRNSRFSILFRIHKFLFAQRCELFVELRLLELL